MILKTIEVGEDFKTNNYLVIDENSKEAVLIDCTGDFEKISALIKEYEASLKYILLTHGHFDHIGGCDEFKKKTKAKLFVNKNDQYLLDNIKIQCGYFNMPVFEKPQIDEFITEKTKLALGEHEIKVFETKGHTPGGMAYLIDDMLFSGDTLFFEEVGRCDLPGGNFEEIGKSIKDKLYKLPNEVKVYPGHGVMTTIGHEKANNSYFKG